MSATATAPARNPRRCKSCNRFGVPEMLRYGPMVRDLCYSCLGEEYMKSLCACGMKLPQNRKQCFDCKPRRTSRRHADRLPDVVCECACCGKEFGLRPYVREKRLKQNGGSRLYCSRACGGTGVPGQAGNVGGFKRKPGWSDDRWFWELELIRFGLGMSRGLPRWLEFGLEELGNFTTEGFVVSDRQR